LGMTAAFQLNTSIYGYLGVAVIDCSC
jgi:hypothetical protein